MTPRPLMKSENYLDDEITVERRVRVPGQASEQISSRKTTKMDVVDARLIAIARGEIEPDPQAAELVALDDPFGGLILVEDEDTAAIDEEWLVDEYTPEPVVPHAIVLTSIPRLCMTASALVALPLDNRSGFLLSHIDGERTVEEVIDVANLSAADALEVLADLANLGAITIG